ncbi:MAG TPA: substrate-binding domain-containing protein [Acidimicrobiales bacterium]
MKKLRKLGIAGVSLSLLPLSLLVTASTPSSAAASPVVNVVGYSIVSPAFTALEKGFAATTAGAGVAFNNSFGASTTQAEDVVAGQAADVVDFSQVPDLDLLVNAGLVSSSWQAYPASKPEHGFVTDSVVAIVVRAGNPEGITGWNSLTHSGVQIVTPDPISSGSARWNLLAAYESQLQQGKKPAKAKSYLNHLVGNVVSEPPSGSKALATFLSGTGNVLLAYEADAETAKAAGDPIQIVNPQQNVLIQNPSALTTTGLTNPAAVAFYDYLYSSAGQAIWIGANFRATLPSAQTSNKGVFYTPTKLALVSQLGGWTLVTNKYFAPSTGLVTKIESAHGYTS